MARAIVHNAQLPSVNMLQKVESILRPHGMTRKIHWVSTDKGGGVFGKMPPPLTGERGGE